MTLSAPLVLLVEDEKAICRPPAVNRRGAGYAVDAARYARQALIVDARPPVAPGRDVSPREKGGSRPFERTTRAISPTPGTL